MAPMATVSSKGQLVIPVEIRKKLRLKGGSKVAVEEVNGEIRIKPNPYDELLALRGKYAGLDLEGDLAESRRKDEKKLEALYETLRS